MTDIKFLGMAPSSAVEQAIEGWIARLARLHARITSCTVVVELPHRHHQRGNAFHVRIDLAIPECVLVTSSDRGNKDVYLAIADAFIAARRQLTDHVRQRRERVAA